MKIFFIFAAFAFIGPLLLIQILEKIPILHELELDSDSKIYVGEGEVCETPITKLNCQEGLICTIITEKPQRNAVCLPPGANLDEDLSYKYGFDNIDLE